MTNSVLTRDDYVTLAEAARMLRKHRQTVRRLISRGELRAVRDGRAILVLRCDVESYYGRLLEQGAAA